MTTLKLLFSQNVGTGRLESLLQKATCLYIGVPALLFVFGWLQWWLAGPLATAIAWAFWKNWNAREENDAQGKLEENRITVWSLVLCFVLAAWWGGYSGAGGLAAQTQDWTKHMAVFKDLSTFSWPVVFSIPFVEKPVPLAYYHGYYLLPALVTKYAGWTVGCYVWMGLTMLGTGLVGLWFAALVGRKVWLLPMLFALFGGLDFLGTFILEPKLQAWDFHYEWWAAFSIVQYPSNGSLIVWVPQHALAGWLATCMLMQSARHGRGFGCAGLVCGLVSIWSPFAFLGLIPFLLLEIVRRIRDDRWRDLLTVANLSGLIFAAVVALFLSAHAHDIPKSWLWQAWDIKHFWVVVLLFFLFEFVIYSLFSNELWSSSVKNWRAWGRTTFVVLMLFPWYRMGGFNDLLMRGSIPALTVLWVFIARDLLVRRWNTNTRILALFLCFGAVTGGSELIRTWGSFPAEKPLPRREAAHVWQLESVIAQQYEGTLDSFFWRHLARPWAAQKENELTE